MIFMIPFRNALLLLALASLMSCGSSRNLSQTPIGLVNNVSYQDSEFSNSNAGNGFLVNYNKETYAITAKHVLMIAKTPKMQFVDFKGELKQWKMHAKDDSSKVVVLDQLLSTNQKDSLTWNYMDTNWDNYNDWLVFSIKDNQLDHKALKFRKKPLVLGEKLFIIGWSYGDKTGAQRIYEYTFMQTDGDYHEIVQVKGPENLGGLSGSPVVDERGRLVGLVSSGWEDEETQKTIVAATSTKQILAFLTAL